MILFLVFVIALLPVVPAYAHPPFCSDFNGDGKTNGKDMADFHKLLNLGQDHKPGVDHTGYSVCHTEH